MSAARAAPVLAAAMVTLACGVGLAQTPPLQGQADIPPGPVRESGTLVLGAVFSSDNKPIRSGLVWRVFTDAAADGRQNLVAKSTAATPTISLAPGPYTIHVAYGFASASRRVSVTSAGATGQIPIAAGALKLAGAIGDTPVPANRIAFSVYLPVGGDSEGRLVVGNVRVGDVVRLPEGTYHVVSAYGESNAIMRVDLKVEAGRLTDATINHRAATVTLKLVTSQAGEAFAGTAFSVLTPGGDVIREAIGAFPTVTLAEGDYVLIARHDGRVFTRDFKVESGLDRDIEVLAKDP